MSENPVQKPEVIKAINAFSQNNFKEAEQICLELLSRDSDADANHIVGCIRMGQRKFDESISYINKSLEISPDNIGTLISLGCVLSSKKDYLEAIKVFKKIIKLKDDISQVHFYLGEAYRQTLQNEKSLSSFKKCLEITPDHIGCQLMVGIIYEELKKFNQAIDFYKACINTYPEYIEPHINLGMCYLLTGNYAEGWNEYEWRLKLQAQVYEIKFKKPRWVGQDLSGKTLVIATEQSVGEILLFIRFAKQLAFDGAKIIVMTQGELKKILESQKWINKVISYDDEAPDCDYYTYLLSIPKVLEWNPKMDTQTHPYLEIDKENFSEILPDKKNIGYLLAPDMNSSTAKQTAIPEKDINSLIDTKNINFINLSEIKDIDVLAGIIQNLDLVICVESDLAYLAGSLNISTFLILPVVPKHLWDLSYKSTSPWYPSLELFRQETSGDWTNVINEIQGRLTSV
ncbi:MAG: tetratricopeptide repeat-containing glycosyltransferase family protein [Gammaproteobacteria bacterium]|nr:tetratricopeptide repeat-containing glycosyltransferase family protein [Gammaproteobacteria bacterium]|tara:strand:+ start:777 stop:2150 length:1374 start_codon:yes stop_codon:yes gene_type:complete